MPAPIVQADYDQLDEIASRFQSNADITDQMTQRLRQMADSLHSGGWIGRGVDAFYAEMSGEVLPAMNRLAEALAQGSAATLDISETIRIAEEEAAALFQGDATGSVSGSGSPGAPGDSFGPGNAIGGPAGSPPTGGWNSGSSNNSGGNNAGGNNGGFGPGNAVGGPAGAPPPGGWEHGENGVNVASGATLGGKPINADNRPGVIPDSVPDARQSESKFSWARNPQTGDWERVPVTERPKGRLEENNVAVEAVLYEADLPWAQHEASVWGDEWEGSLGRLEVDALGYETTGKVKVAVTAKDGLVASGTLSGEAYLGRAEYNGRFGPDAANIEAKADVLVGAQAGVTGQAILNPLGGDLYASAGGEAFVGVTAGGEIKGNIGEYGSVGADGKVGAGLGVEGNIDAGLIDGGIRIDASLGGYLGVGATGGFTVEIKPVEIVKDVGGGLADAGGWVAGKFGW